LPDRLAARLRDRGLAIDREFSSIPGFEILLSVNQLHPIICQNLATGFHAKS